MDKESICFFILIALASSIIIGISGWTIHLSNVKREENESVLQSLSSAGYELKTVKLNSPVYSVKVDDIDDFLSFVRVSSNPKTIFKTTYPSSSIVQFLYTFDKDLKVGYYYEL